MPWLNAKAQPELLKTSDDIRILPNKDGEAKNLGLLVSSDFQDAILYYISQLTKLNSVLQHPVCQSIELNITTNEVGGRKIKDYANETLDTSSVELDGTKA